ncbi:hypothetical protein Ade02nite_21120 [Paractinoplanes deccanensis]|uniref:GIY-YIG domain-containing protein n=1 Tax=Paractinoplanes deccanensis TaxID=113561 RepID=A0ABQ3Y0E7_9ACTN|nr:GIY-YIG nuclease family protein [Actinoplanes deccanensis]GID73471.1 hypothetical protein Ade02nite_21120 [Actinoplanes deccanensis]
MYRLYDSEGAFLYVGIAVVPESRWYDHAREKPWWPEVDMTRTVVDWLPDRVMAAEEEDRVIKTGEPRYNIAGSPNRPRRHPHGSVKAARSLNRHRPRATIAGADDDGLWTELGQVVGDNRRSEVTRQLWAAFLKRPKSPMPRRRDYERNSEDGRRA